jgi:hypothetical protein
MPTFRLVTASAKYGSRKIKSKRRNGGTQALREEAAKSGAGGKNYGLIIRAAEEEKGRADCYQSESWSL